MPGKAARTVVKKTKPVDKYKQYISMEKVVRARKYTDGRMSYKIKWVGNNLPSSWEPMEVVPNRLIRRFVRQNIRILHCQPHVNVPADSAERKLEFDVSLKIHDGFDMGYTVKRILGATEHQGKVYYLVDWAEEEGTHVLSHEDCRTKSPQQLIRFLEARIVWGEEEDPFANDKTMTISKA